MPPIIVLLLQTYVFIQKPSFQSKKINVCKINDCIPQQN